MASGPRREQVLAGILIGVGLCATLVGVWRAAEGATLINGSFWAGWACLVGSGTMIRSGRDRPRRRALLVAIAGLALLMSLYSTFEQAGRQRRVQDRHSVSP